MRSSKKLKFKDIIKQENFCSAPWFHTIISPRGTTRVCSDYEGLLGDLSGSSFEEEYNNSKMRELRRAILNNEIFTNLDYIHNYS